MQPKFLLVASVAMLFTLAAFRLILPPPENNTPQNLQAFKMKNAIYCTPDWEALKVWMEQTDIPAMPGWGDYHWDIHSANDSAQYFFDQGISLYYAFHIIEGMASFKKAQKFDPDNAMLYWAEALAYGPNINDLGYTASPEALKATENAARIGGKNEVEQHLISAMQKRYSHDSAHSRIFLNQQYADAMNEAYKKFENNADVAALYADALMIQHPWDLWHHNGEPKPWTPHIVNVLENMLALHPNHPGANHYYIHAVEASPNPEKAMASADRLGNLMPQVSHIVHMPSHIYIRTGKYKKGTQVNETALKGYETYFQLYPAVAENAFIYVYHNLHMQAACAQMDGNYAYAMETSMDARNSFDTSFMSLPTPVDGFMQYVYMTPVFTQIRFGKWDDILNNPTIPDHYNYASLLDHFAKGLAQARKGNTAKAQKHLAEMESRMDIPMMKVPMGPFNAPQAGATVAIDLLQGAIAESIKDYAQALQHYTKAVDDEINMIYTEPKDWLLPARHFLAAAQLKAGKYADAQKTLEEDLLVNPDNGWALYGLYTSLQSQKKSNEASDALNRFKTAFAESDVKIQSAVYY